MAQAQKFQRIAAVIEQRVRRGDYLLRPLPSERKIAEETGVSHMTARKAVRELLDRKVLIRGPNGALDVAPGFHADAGPPPVLMLYPAFASTYLMQLWQTVSDAAEAYGLSVRPVQYLHWDDPVVISAASNPGGVIVIPTSPEVPEHVLPRLRSNRVVLLDVDFTEQQIPSIQVYTDDHLALVLDHLRELGHARIDCISTQFHNSIIEGRIRLWRDWMDRHKITGELLEHAAPSFTDPTPYAYEKIKKRLGRGRFNSTALVATTFPAAVGALRACWEHGLVPGRDVSVCAMNIEHPAKFMMPSVTGVDMPDLTEVLGRCFKWFLSDKPWSGPLCLAPSHAEFFAGESTGPTPPTR